MRIWPCSAYSAWDTYIVSSSLTTLTIEAPIKELFENRSGRLKSLRQEKPFYSAQKRTG